ncbi:MAG: pyridoxal phosphate-dependent decarboxylase family protein [Planctomycetota bacterium]
MSEDRSLELTRAEMNRLVDLAMRRIVDHLERLPEMPAANAEGAEDLARSVMEPVPRTGQEFDDLLTQLFEEYIPKSFLTPGPGYLAYIPGGGLFHAALADLISGSVNRYVGVWAAAPALAQIEVTVLRWLCEIVGYGEGSGGVLTTGSSIANWSAVVTARRSLLPENFLEGTIYTSDQTHHSVQKAAMLAGFPERNVRSIESDERFCIKPAALRAAIEEDPDPFLVVSNAGTTSTGAVDDLEAIADIAGEHGLWHHVDGAYGGCFMLTERGRRTMRGIERADSISLDPHKGFFLPYGTGSLLVRDLSKLKQAHALHAEYLPPMQDDPDFVDFCEVSPELSRDFRGLRLWLPIKMHGIEPFERNLEEKLDLAAWAADELRGLEGIEVVAEPQLSTVAFRLRSAGMGQEALNELNRRFLRAINARGRVYLTATTVRGDFLLRICVLSFRTHMERMREGMQDIAAALKEITSGSD